MANKKIQKNTDDKKNMRKKKNPLKYDMNMVQKVAAVLEASNIEEFLDIRSRPMRLIFWNFVIGLSRGFGFLLGATILGAIFMAWGRHIVTSLGGLPWIGEKIAAAVIYIGDLVKEGVANK